MIMIVAEVIILGGICNPLVVSGHCSSPVVRDYKCSTVAVYHQEAIQYMYYQSIWD